MLGCWCSSCIRTVLSAQLAVQHLFLKVLGLGTAVLLCLQTESFKTCYFLGKKKKERFLAIQILLQIPLSLIVAVLNVLHQTSTLFFLFVLHLRLGNNFQTAGSWKSCPFLLPIRKQWKSCCNTQPYHCLIVQ